MTGADWVLIAPWKTTLAAWITVLHDEIKKWRMVCATHVLLDSCYISPMMRAAPTKNTSW